MFSWQQWQAFLRLALVAGGVQLARNGVVSAGDWHFLQPYVEAFIGSTVSLAAVLWTWWSHRPRTIIATAHKLRGGRR